MVGRQWLELRLAGQVAYSNVFGYRQLRLDRFRLIFGLQGNRFDYL